MPPEALASVLARLSDTEVPAKLRSEEIDLFSMVGGDTMLPRLSRDPGSLIFPTTSEMLFAMVGRLPTNFTAFSIWYMALSNKTGAIVLTTGNKSEMATGYCTLYGDMAGGFAVIKDVAKTLVYRLAEWKNRQPTVRADGSVGPVIPERIITRPPSAELRPDQTDQDSLPPYEVLDAILAAYMEENVAIDDIVAAGYERTDVERVTRLIKVNEYKRRQSPVGIRITHRGFGRDWRYPITSRFRA